MEELWASINYWSLSFKKLNISKTDLKPTKR
jgi:hypothetical protein